jgi:hypothetical protein
MARWLQFDPRKPTFLVDAVRAVREATRDSGQVIFVLDPVSLSDESSRRAVMDLLREPCGAGLLVPADAGRADAKALVEAYQDELRSGHQSGNWVVRTALGTMADFHIAADSVFQDLLARIVASEPLRHSLPENMGPTERPRMTNRLGNKQAA